MPINKQKKSTGVINKNNQDSTDNKSKGNPENIIFSLDIGTRSVVGIVGIEEKGVFNILDVEIVEHTSRAMLDGQIHEISKVVEVVNAVKERLEGRLGFELTKVAIAAAGRSLKTNSAMVDRKLQTGTVITQDMINSLELEGIQIAYENLHKETNDDTTYYCIGHTVINYYLNGYIISDLVGHKGKVMSANVLATFLPHTVVDSLYAVMDRVGLKIISLTLEPIAAINVSIPKDVRLLNLAMVDIGAGTSDIAITKDGTITAYAMCSVAGDEITEKIAQYYLLDFHTAERVKTELHTTDVIEFIDIMGLPTKVKSSDIIKILQPAVEHLADVISQKILECNGKSPNAVFCIGGGSHTPGLTKLLADKLSMPAERVGVRGTDIIKNIKIADKKLDGPEAITPIGIAITALAKRGHDFVTVKVNNKSIKIFNTNYVTVGDALTACEFAGEHLIPRRGISLTFELNRKTHVVKGGYGVASQISVNSKPANIETKINTGDNIKVIPSKEGSPAKAYIGDFVKPSPAKKVVLNNNDLEIATKIVLNGKPATIKQEIKEGDRLVIEEINTIKDLIEICEIDLSKFYITVNCTKVDEEYVIKSGDIINTVQKNGTEEADFYINTDNQNNDLNFENINKSVKISSIAADSIDNKTGRKGLIDRNKDDISVYVNNNIVKLKGKSKYIFIDVFNHYKVDMADPKTRVDLKLNGMPASFTDNIREGDNLEISWV